MIAVIQGGPSNEAAVSRVTSKAMQDALTELGLSFDVYEADQNLFENLKSKKYTHALIALHGRYGEDGIVQGICEYLRIPYSGSGVLASALAFHKERTKQQFKILNIPTPEGFLIIRRKGLRTEEYQRPHKYPAIIKPNQDGSSVGIYICQNEAEYLKSLAEALVKFSELVEGDDSVQENMFTDIDKNESLMKKIDKIRKKYDYGIVKFGRTFDL